MLWLGGAVGVALLLSVAFWPGNGIGCTPDSYEYMQGGLALWSGQGFKDMSGHDQLCFPPAYPAAIGAVARAVHDPFLAGRLMSLLASLGSLVLLHLLARTLFSPTAGLVAAWIFALMQLRISLSTMVWSESMFAMLVLAGLVLWVVGRSRAAAGLAAGLALGAASLTRPEGLLVFGVLVLWELAQLVRRVGQKAASRQSLLLLVAGFAVVSLPYLLYLHSHTGKWQFTAKTAHNWAIASARTEEVPWEQLVLLSPDDRRVVPPAGSASLRMVAVRVARNIGNELALLFGTMPKLLLACIAIGLALLPRWPRDGSPLVGRVLAALGSPLLVIPFFFIEMRMVFLPAVVLILLAVLPLASGGKTGQPLVGGRRRQVVVLFLALGLIASGCRGYRVLRDAHDWLVHYRATMAADAENTQAAALEALRQMPGPIVGNGVAKRLAFQSGNAYLPLPWATRERVVRYARLNGAAFLLFQGTDHPDLAALARSPTASRDLEPVATLIQSNTPGQPASVGRLYRLRPCPHLRP